MSKIIIRGGNRLTGKVKISGAKNAVLPIIAASILGKKGSSLIREVPSLDDVKTICKVVKALGADVIYHQDTIQVNAQVLSAVDAPQDLIRKMRASILVMGPLLAREGHARVSLPGGCAIGSRPIDQHLKGFEALGAKIEIGNGHIEAKVNGKLKGSKIYLDVSSVGATENIMMAATLAEGTTLIENAAKEPEIVDLANYLNSMGAIVRGAGTGTIRIEGVKELRGTEHTVIPDRIEAGTYMTAAAITNGDIYLENVIPDHLRPVIAKLEEMGVRIIEEDSGIRIYNGMNPLRSVNVKTLPYPGFPTDMQSQMMALLMTSAGKSIVTETVFENRFMHVDQFRKMNANIKIDGQSAMVQGGTQLRGANVCATDLRAGAALVICGLAAEGRTTVTGVSHIDRGYVDLTGKLRNIGADIERVESTVQVNLEKPAEMSVVTAQPSWA